LSSDNIDYNAKTTELAGFTASPVPSETFIKSNTFDYVPNMKIKVFNPQGKDGTHKIGYKLLEQKKSR
jgi:hypothetical protein